METMPAAALADGPEGEGKWKIGSAGIWEIFCGGLGDFGAFFFFFCQVEGLSVTKMSLYCYIIPGKTRRLVVNDC
jgi:hypothetical protein